MLRSFQRLLLLLALFGAQVVGLHRGYICDCGGQERVTRMDHCHGPHEHDCEEEEEPHHEHEEGEPVHEHPALIESLQADKVHASAFTFAQAPLLVELPLEAFFVPDIQLESWDRFHPPRENSRAGPFWPSRLSQTISLRI